MEILIKLPDEWLNAEHMENLDFMIHEIKAGIRDRLTDAITEQVELPKITFTEEELRPLVRERVVSRMADKAFDK